VQYDVVVILHEAIGQDLGVEAIHRGAQNVQKGRPVKVITKDGVATASARGHVVDGVWKLDSERACHAVSMLEPNRIDKT